MNSLRLNNPDTSKAEQHLFILKMKAFPFSRGKWKTAELEAVDYETLSIFRKLVIINFTMLPLGG